MLERFKDEKLVHAAPNEVPNNVPNGMPNDAQSRPANHGLRLAIVSSALMLLLAFFLALKPTSARAVWAEFARLIELKGGLKGTSLAMVPAESSARLDARLVNMPPQQQAELLASEAVDHNEAAISRIASRTDGWHGQLTMSPRLSSLLESALNSNDLRVRAAAIDVELVAYNLPATEESANTLIQRIETDPAGRPWALWMLGAIGNRGIEQERALGVLQKYSHDSDENIRFWAVEGLSLLGSDATIHPLVEIFHNDSSLRVRERAGCGVAQCGMLTKKQRMTAVPALIQIGEDPSLDSNTRDWVYQALRNITGARYGTNTTDWREWWADNAPR
jgi:hypothetical protein